MRTALTRAAAGLAGVTVACLAFTMAATPASAHTKLQSSDPKSGARLDEAPNGITLVFNDPLRGRYTQVGVRGPDGNNYETGPPQTVDGTVTQRVQPLRPAGKYRIGYRVVAPDGHPLTGTITFTLTEPGPAASATPAAPGSGSVPGAPATAARRTDGSGEGVPAALLLGGGFGAVLLIGAVLAFRRREKPADDTNG
jgi:copper resistance protein C